MAEGAAKPSRDLRLDFFRGLSLFFIFIDHIPENILGNFTLRSAAFCDAADVFIFISGFTATLVYGTSLRQHGVLFATAQVWRRVWQLYVAHIFLFVLFIAEVSYALLVVKNAMYTEELGVGDFLQTPHLAIIRALLLAFQPNYLDILPLYIVLLGVFPLVLVGLERRRFLPLIVSGVLYLLTLRFGWAPHTYPGNRTWFFNPLAWQFLFVIGATAASLRNQAKPIWWPTGRWPGRIATGIAAVAAIINASWTIHWAYDPFPGLLLHQLYDWSVDKTNLAPLRLLNFLALAITTVYWVKPESSFLKLWPAKVIILCGQHSLYVFCLTIILSLFGHFLLEEFSDNLLMHGVVNILGMAVMIGAAALLEWYKRASRATLRAAVPATPSE